MVSRIRLLELMSARMFHDLAGPIGAVHNSIEFFEEEDQVIREKALQILHSSANESILRLKFFRQAYGIFSDQEIHLSIILPLIKEFLLNSKLTLNWQEKQGTLVDGYVAKIILNFIIIALGIMIFGGELIIQHDIGKIKIILKGKELIFSEETELLLKGDSDHVELTSANIQIYYTYMMIETVKAKLKINKDVKMLEFVITY